MRRSFGVPELRNSIHLCIMKINKLTSIVWWLLDIQFSREKETIKDPVNWKASVLFMKHCIEKPLFGKKWESENKAQQKRKITTKNLLCEVVEKINSINKLMSYVALVVHLINCIPFCELVIITIFFSS